jgi:hypothetical protein
MKAYGGVDVYVHVFLISAVVGGELSASRPGRFTLGTHLIEVGWTPEPVWTTSLSRLRYPGSKETEKYKRIRERSALKQGGIERRECRTKRKRMWKKLTESVPRHNDFILLSSYASDT